MFDTVLKNPWIRALGAVLTLSFIVLLVYLLLPILTALFISFLVAYLLSPVVDWGERWRIPRMVTIAVLLIALMLVAILLPLYLVTSTIQEADRLITCADEALSDERLDTFLSRLPLHELVVYLEWVPEGTTEFDAPTVFLEHVVEGIRENARMFLRNYGGRLADTGEEVGYSLAQALHSVGNWALSTISFFVNLSLFAFVAAYLLRDYDALIAGLRDLVPPRHLPFVDDIMHKIDLQLRSLLRGQITICATLGLLYGVGLHWAGTPFAAAIGVFGGLASIVPYVGPFLTITPALGMTLLSHGIDISLVYVLLVFTGVQILESYFLTPRVLGSHIGLNPVWIIIALMVFSTAFGFIGVVIAVPTAAVLKVLVLEAHDRYRRSRFYTESEPIPASANSSSSACEDSSSSGSSGINAS